MWRARVTRPRAGEMPQSRRPGADEARLPPQRAWDDLQRVMGRDAAQRIVEAAYTLVRAPKPDEPAGPGPVPEETESAPERDRDGYFEPGGYAARNDAEAEGRYLEWRRLFTGRDPEAWEESSPDPDVRLDLWVARELDRAGLPAWLRDVVLRMVLVTQRDGVEVARRTLLEESVVPEDLHFAIDGILKRIPPLI